MISNPILPQSKILDSQNGMSGVDGATTEPRTPINRPDGEKARCSVSRVLAQPRDFSQLSQLLTTISMFNFNSFQKAHTAPSLNNVRGTEFSCSSFNNVTMPSGVILISLRTTAPGSAR